MTAVLADLAHRVVYVDRNPALVEKARERFFKHGVHNVDVVQASADTGLELDAPCDLILCTTFIQDPKALLPNLREGGESGVPGGSGGAGAQCRHVPA